MKSLFPLALLLLAICRPAPAQDLILSTGHQGPINDIAFSADGKYMVTASVDNMAVLWDVAAGLELRTFRIKNASMRQAAFVPGRTQIVTLHTTDYPESARLCLWDMVTGAKIWEKMGSNGGHLLLAPDGSQVYSGGRWYSLEDGSPLTKQGAADEHRLWGYHDGIVQSIFSEDRKSYQLHAIDVKSGTITGTVKGKLDDTYWTLGPFALSPDQSLMAVSVESFRNPKLELWKLKENRLQRTIFGNLSRDDQVFISPDNNVLFINGHGKLTAVAIATGDTLYQVKDKDKVYEPTFTPDGKLIASYDGDYRKINFRDPATGKVVREITGHSCPVRDMRFSEDGKYIVAELAFGGHKGWDIKTGQFIPKLPGYVDVGRNQHSEHPTLITQPSSRGYYERIYPIHENFGVVYNDANKRGLGLFTVDSTDWMVNDGKGHLDGSPGALKQLYEVRGLTIIRDVKDTLAKYVTPGLFKQIVSPGKSGGRERKQPKIIISPIAANSPAPELRAKIVKGGMVMPSVQIFLNGRLIIEDARDESGFNTADKMLDEDTMQIVVPFKKYKDQPFALWGKPNVFEIKAHDEDENTFAKAEIEFTPRYHAEPEMILPLGHIGVLSAMAISPSGAQVATARYDVRLWDVKSGRETRTFNINGGFIRNLQYSADSKYLIATYENSENGMLQAIQRGYGARMWNLETGAEEPWPFPNNTFAYLSEDGRYLINLTKSLARNLATGKDHPLPQQEYAELRHVSVSADGKTAAALLYNNGREKGPKAAYTMIYWDMTAGKELYRWELELNGYEHVYLSPAGNWIVLREGGAAMSIWKQGSKKPLKKYGDNDGDLILDFAFSPAEDSVYTVNRDGRTLAWSIANGGTREIIPAGLRDAFYRFSPTGNMLMAGVASAGELISLQDGHLQQRFKGAVRPSDHVAMSGASNAFMFANRYENWVKHFTFQPGEPLTVLQHQRTIHDVIYTADGKYMLTLENEGDGYVWSPEDGHLIRVLSDSGYHIKDLSVLKDNRRALMITSHLEGSKYMTKTIDLETGQNLPKPRDDEWYDRQLGSHNNKIYAVGNKANGAITFGSVTYGTSVLATFVPLDSCDWVMYTSDGYYMASRNGAEKIYFDINKRQYFFDQFDLRYNRPDKILERTGAPREIVETYRAAYLKRIEKMGFDSTMFEKDWVYNVPQVEVTPGSIRQRDSLYTFTLNATDSLYHLDRILLTVNGVPVYGDGLSVKARKSGKLQQQLQLVLSAGHNEIRASVLNEQGVESLAETLEADYTAPPRKPDLYILAIGAGTYRDNAKNLRYAAKDAEEVVALFAADASQYGRVIPLLVKDSAVTATNILQNAQQLLQSKVDDKVIVFYAGHGMFDTKKDYYLGCYPTVFKQPATGSLPYDSLEALLARVPSRKKVMLLDACYSGEIDKANTNIFARADAQKGKVKMEGRGEGAVTAKNFNAFDLMKNTFRDLRKGAGATVLAAAGGLERAGEYDHLENGAFTYCLKKGLREQAADRNKDGKVVLSELLQYLQEEVPKLTHGMQRPVSRIENRYQDIAL